MCVRDGYFILRSGYNAVSIPVTALVSHLIVI